MTFQELKIGDKFHTGKSKGVGIMSNVVRYNVWEKVSKSQAKCVDSINFSNFRAIGKVEKFSSNVTVFEV